MWGAYPRHTPEDIQSGMGKNGNSYCISGVVKAVIRAPFTFGSQNKVPTNRRGHLLQTQRATDLAIHWNGYRLAKLLAYVIFGI